MGDTGYRTNEEKSGAQNRDYAESCSTAGSVGSDAVGGYKKLVAILLAFAVIVCFRAFVLERVVVSGESMNPAFEDGDVMWARKFGVDELARYQVVTAKVSGKPVIKRVIGLPGETVQIVEGSVHIDGEKLPDDYGYQTTLYGVAESEIVLKENEYFLLGDNRDHSGDSREWGAVAIEDLTGVVVFRFFPFWKIGAVD